MAILINITKINKRINTKAIIVTVLCLICVLLSALTVFHFARINTPSGDDFAFDTLASNHTPFSLSIGMFMSYTARLSNIFIMGSILELLSPFQLSKLAFPISFTILLLSFFMMLNTFLINIKKSLKLMISILLTFASIMSSQTIYENFFWMPGVITYVLPILFMSILIKLILQGKYKSKRNNRAELLVSFNILLISTVSSFISEPFNIQMVFVLLGILVYEIITNKRAASFNIVRNITVSVATILVCTLVMIKAPGTNIRTSIYKSSNQSTASEVTLKKTLSFTIKGSFSTSIKFIRNNYFYLIPIYFIVLLANSKFKRVNLRKLAIEIALVLLASLIFCITMFLSLFIVFAQTLSEPTNYSYITSNVFVIIFPIVFFGMTAKPTPSKARKVVAFGGRAYAMFVLVFILNIFVIYNFDRINYPLIKKQYLINNSIFPILETNRGKKNLRIEPTSYDNTKYFTYCTLNQNPSSWCNSSIGSWYDIDELYLSPK